MSTPSAEAPSLARELRCWLSELTRVLVALYDEMVEPHATMPLMVTVCISVMSVFLFLYFCRSSSKRVPKERSRERPEKKPRFRKRDKVMFYGRKMLRKVRMISDLKAELVRKGKLKFRKRPAIPRFANKLLFHEKEAEPQLVRKEPPPSILEADMTNKSSETILPAEVLYMLKSVRVFGHFEQPVFFELCKYIQSLTVLSGQCLFRIGDMDDSIYVVQSGKVRVFITDSDGAEFTIKEVDEGDSVHSLLSVLDVLTGHPQPYKTVSARALVDTAILKLPGIAFQKVFEHYPETLVRVTQMIMVRLQRVTFFALYKYLGLSSQLMRQEKQAESELAVYELAFLSKARKRRSKSVVETRSRSRDRSPTAARQLAFERASKVGRPSEEVRRVPTSPALRSEVEAAAARVRAIQDVPDTLMHSQSVRKQKSMPAAGTDFDQSEAECSLILAAAKKDLLRLFGLRDEQLLEGRLRTRFVSAGSVLVRQGDHDSALLFLISGLLSVTQRSVEKNSEVFIFLTHPGELVGSLAVLTGEPSLFTVRAKQAARVVCIPKPDFYQIIRDEPRVVLQLAHLILRRVSPFVRQIDFALDWRHIDAGRALYRQDEAADSIHIVLNGRLRSVVASHGKKHLVSEYGRGELVGVIEVLTRIQRTSTVIAIRDTELACIPELLLSYLKHKYPQVVTRLIHLLGQRLASVEKPLELASEAPPVNLSTIAVLASSYDVPLTQFSLELCHALDSIGSTLRLTSDLVLSRLGASVLDSVNEYRLSAWLGQQEDAHRIVLYQCDASMTPWTQRCVRQADCILIVARADREPSVVGELERGLEHMPVRAQKELILLYPDAERRPKGTVRWLNARGWCSSHHHIRCPKRVFRLMSPEQMVDAYSRLFEHEPDKHSDFSRLARMLTGHAVGIVLGGGGARGLSHAGVIQALVEADIPIDLVGGTSIGAMLAALWASERELGSFVAKARHWSFLMTSLWKRVVDLTYPYTSMFTGAAFNGGIEEAFGEQQIEDLWIPYFCVTTDITASRIRVHRNGSVWRYVRASMSLAGYLPPLCDPQDGHYLLDGGYINNLPADVMRSLGVHRVIAVDVGALDDTDLTNYGDELSGWWLLWKRWNPFAKPVKVPNMQEIQSRLAYVSSVGQLEAVKNSSYCEYLRPPIDAYGTLQFGAFDEIKGVGYDYAKAMLAERASTEQHDDTGADWASPLSTGRDEMRLEAATTTFTDLAELVSRIPMPEERYSEPDTIEDDEDLSFTTTPEQTFQADVEQDTDSDEGDEPEQATIESPDNGAEPTATSASSRVRFRPETDA